MKLPAGISFILMAGMAVDVSLGATSVDVSLGDGIEANWLKPDCGMDNKMANMNTPNPPRINTTYPSFNFESNTMIVWEFI
jgi:hypothetical protein